jgi:ATP synthase protein I
MGKVDAEQQDDATPPPTGPEEGQRRRGVMPQRFAALATFGALGSVGLSFVLALVIGTALGVWLDRVTGWSPLCFIVFFLLGLVAGIRNVYVTTKKFMK